MNIRIISLAAVVGALAVFAPSADAKLFQVVNVSTAPNTFECNLTAVQFDTVISGQTVHTVAYQDTSPGAVGQCPCDGIPIPEMQLSIGEMVICHFNNSLPKGVFSEGASIHWHGIELDNDSDGTAVSQDSVQQGQTYTYRFVVTRPGLFWFHSHMTPGNTTFAGMYGVIIIPNESESDLIDDGVLPPAQYTYTLAMSDIQFDTQGNVGKPFTQPDNSIITKTINDYVNLCHQNPGGNNQDCNAASTAGTTVLVDGVNPDSNPVTNDVPSGQVIRLQLLNESIARHFRVSLINNHNIQDTDIYRIGGQGGLLNNPRLEGGMQQNLLTGFDEGELNIGSGDRQDGVALLTGNEGDIIELVGNPLKQAGPTFGIDANLPVDYPITYFRIHGVNNPSNDAPCVCQELLEGTDEEVTNIGGLATNALTQPDGGAPGSANPVISLTTGQTTGPGGLNKTEPAIDLSEGVLEGNTGNGDWLMVPRAATARYCHVGDVLELSVKNTSGTVHPFHLHGFSLQPEKILDNNGNLLYTYDYNEFVDTIDVNGTGKDSNKNNTPAQTLVFRVQIVDRPKFADQANGPVLQANADSATGGALGRWLFHCHIFAHASLGMMSELIVVPNAQQQVWSQLPELTPQGWDVLASAPLGSKAVADDFFLTNGPITGVTIWGSWLNDLIDPNPTFELKFWTDVPAAGGDPSRPGWQAWEMMFPPGTYSNYLAAPQILYEGFYDPSQNFLGIDTQVYQYSFNIPEFLAYYPLRAQTNWLSVTAYTTNFQFGWKSCVYPDRWNDDASWSTSLIGPTWTDLHYPSGPYYPQSMDQSFILYTGTVAPPPQGNIASGSGGNGGSGGSSGSNPAGLVSTQPSSGTIQLAWPAGMTLQMAGEPSGPWTPMSGVTSPLIVSVNKARSFFRIVPTSQ